MVSPDCSGFEVLCHCCLDCLDICGNFEILQMFELFPQIVMDCSRLSHICLEDVFRFDG